MRKKYSIFLMVLSIGLCSCSTTITSRRSSTDVNFPYDTTVNTGDTNLPTPQLVRVDAGIDKGHLVVRLRQDPAWKAQPEHELLLNDNRERQRTYAPVSPKTEEGQDQYLQAINAAFERAQTGRTSQDDDSTLTALRKYHQSPMTDVFPRLNENWHDDVVVGDQISRVYSWPDCSEFVDATFRGAEAAGYRLVRNCP